MTEPIARAAVDQIVQLGVEVVAGTQVPATKRLPGLSLDIKPIIDVETFRAYGFNVDTISIIQKEWANGTWTGPGDYNQVVYPLSSLIGLVAGGNPVQQGANPAYLWAFHPVSQGADLDPKTFTAEEGDAIAARISTLLRFSSWGLAFSNTNVTNNGNLFCRFPTDDEALTSSVTSNEIWQIVIDATSGTYTLTYGGNTTAAIDFDATPAELLNALTDLPNVNIGDFQVTGGPGNSGGTTPYFIEGVGALAGTNLTPPTADDALLVGGGSSATITTSQAGGVASGVSLVPQRPVSRKQIDIFIDSTFGAIGTTKVTAAYEGMLSVADKFQPFWALNTTYDSFADSVRIPAKVEASFSTSANAQARALYNSISANPVRYVRWLATGAALGTSAEKIQVDAAVQFAQPEVQRDADGVFGYKFAFNAIHSADMAGAYRVNVINGLSSLG